MGTALRAVLATLTADRIGRMDGTFRLHHLGVLVSDVEEASDRLTRRFGYVVDGPLVEDARQTAVARFLRLPGADGWLELVAPNGPESLLHGALARGGGGTHHVCFQVDDIELACTRLRDDGMWIVAPPVPGSAFGGRRIAWLADRDHPLVELVESGPGPLVVRSTAAE